MKKINFITNQNTSITSGGWSGISANLHKHLLKDLTVNYVGPVHPPMDKLQKVNSKVRRTLGFKGNFSFFSDKRLGNIQSQVEKDLVPADYNFFFGQTPWISCNFDTPYGVYMDADFSTYLQIYSKPSTFSKKDILRITKKEEQWLQKAQNIFVGSQWTWDEMVKNYDLDESQKTVIWTGGNVSIPSKDEYQGELTFTFISLDFVNKGGPVAVEAFQKVKKHHPTAVLKIMGQKPPQKYIEKDGVEYIGYLRKTENSEYQQFISILKESFLMIHPTVMDTMGAVIIESGYFGCPTIAPRSFGIPELIIHNETGLVVDLPFNAETFASQILNLISNPKVYKEMRRKARHHTTTNLTWEAMANKVIEKI